jgi:CRISPR-associated protein Cmr3
VTQHFFTLEPRDAMLVRDGRAMNASVGRGVLFPPPSTLAGLVRTRLGRDATGAFDAGRIPALLEVSVWGPLLARLAPEGTKVADVLFPPPGDCVWFHERERGTFGRRLAPRPVQEIVPGATTDLGDAAELPSFTPGDDVDTRAKPVRHPLLWSRESLFAWLSAPRDLLPAKDVTGLAGLEREIRHHIAIDPATGTVEEGALFGTEGVRMSHRRIEDGRRTFDRFAFLAAWSGTGTLPRSFVPLGGERRGAFLETCTEETARLLAPPPWIDKIRGGARARVLLATPAIFAKGAVPQTVLGARVIAARVDRPDVVSGWSFEHRAPKPTRRLAPAGSVYWVEVPDDAWARRVWMSNVSDDEQDRRDGFGLALVGAA